MSQPASPDPWQAPAARRWPAPPARRVGPGPGPALPARRGTGREPAAGSVTILDNAALGQARTIVRMADILSRILLPADVALALADLATARNRRRALLALVIPVAALAALGALGIRLLTHTGGSPS